MVIGALVAMVLIGAGVRPTTQSDARDSLPPGRRLHPLNCRGGAPLAFDTIVPRSDSGTVVQLAVSFAANPTAGGMEGQGLRPGTCAWVDRPVSEAEPRRLRFTIHYTDSTPERTVGDSGMYWSFLAYTGDSGHLVGKGYRQWHASSPPRPTAAGRPSETSSRGVWLPFDLRHLHWYALGWALVVGLPLLFVTGWWSGWRRLAGLYPDRDTGRGRSIRGGSMVMGFANYRGGVRFRTDESHLHFSTWTLLRPGHPPFSVPWADVAATRDGWPWFPLKGQPVVRLTLARHPTLRILVPLSVGERIVGESGGRLQMMEPRAPATAAH